jgi:biotin carboxylase
MDVEEQQPMTHTSSLDDARGRRRRLREIEVAARRLDMGQLMPAAKSRSGKRVGAGFDFRTEQLLASPGSLPKGRSVRDRERQMRDLVNRVIKEIKVMPGTTDEKISKVPRRLLTARGADGQRLRQELLRNSIIVFFTAGYEGKRFVYEKAHELGVRTVLIDSPTSWSAKLVEEGIVKKFIPVDMSQSSEDVYHQAMEEIEKLSRDPDFGEPDGIATVVELSVATAARMAEALGLPGPLPEAVDQARDKHRTRGCLADAGLPTPPYHRIESQADLAAAAREVGFPAVLKPISGAASLGVKKVENSKELLETFKEVDAELRSLVVSSGALVKDDGQGQKAEHCIGTTFMLERYLDGAEVDVDVVMSEGEWQYAAVSDNGPTLEPYFNETWAVTPSLLRRQEQVALKELAISSVKALGFTDGIFHVECKYTSIGPQLIEVNARMGGGPVYSTNLRTWNVDLVVETLLLSVGIPSRPDVPREPLVCIANSDVNTLRSGKLVDLSFLEPLKQRPDVLSYDPHVAAGEEVIGPADGLPTWLVEIIVAKPTPREALDFLLLLEAEIQSRVKLA